MNFLKNIILFVLQVTLVMSLSACHHKGGAPPAETPPEVPAVDLTGEWGTNELASGTYENSWERGTLSVFPDNSTSSSAVDSSGTSTSSSGAVNTSLGGAITVASSNGIDVYMDSGGSVIHGVTIYDNGTAGIYTALKRAASYSTGDLEGTWRVSVLASGPGAPWWERGLVTVNSLGDFTASTVDIFGNAGHLTSGGALTVSPEGVITMAAHPTLGGSMDFDKTVMVWSETRPDGTTELAVLTRLTTSYSLSDLVGTWRFSIMSTGVASSVAKGTATVSADGSAVIEFENQDGTSGVYSRDLSILSDGTVTIEGFQNLEGAMDSGKTVIVFTDTWVLNSLAGSDLIIFTKQ